MSERRKNESGVWKIISTCFISGLLTLNIFVLNGLNSHVNSSFDRIENTMQCGQTSIKVSIKDLDDKIFKHLTNDEMHTPRGMIVTNAEFKMYSLLADQSKETLEKAVTTLSEDTKKQLLAIRRDIKELIGKKK